MKHLFISNVVTSQAYNDATPADVKRFFQEVEKVAKEHGLKLVFYGTPWGVPESLTYVLESDKSLDNLAMFNFAFDKHLKKLGWKSYSVSQTTITVTALE